MAGESAQIRLSPSAVYVGMAVQSKLGLERKHSVAAVSLLAGLYFLRTRLVDLAVEKSKKRQSRPFRSLAAR